MLAAAAPLKLLPMPLVPIVLLAIVAAAFTMFWLLARRWTAHRPWLALNDWAESHGFTLMGNCQNWRHEALLVLGQQQIQPILCLTSGAVSLIQVELAGQKRWNLLLGRLATAWPTTALRPTTATDSVVDFLPLETMYMMLPGERFVMYSVQRDSGQTLGKSVVRALLPADVGLILSGNHLILDFSTRPFDGLEFSRMAALATQLSLRLEAVGKS